MGLGSLYSHSQDGKSVRLLDTSLLGECLRAAMAAVCGLHGQHGVPRPAPFLTRSEPPPNPAVPTRCVAEHNLEVQRLCAAMEQQIQQEKQRLEQEVGLLAAHPLQPSTLGGPSTPKPRWVGRCRFCCCHSRAWPEATCMAWSCSECWMPAKGRCSVWSQNR